MNICINNTSFNIFCFLISISISDFTKSQNLVPNSSFEEFVDFSKTEPGKWHKVQDSDTPDYFNLNGDKPYNNIFDKYTGGASPKSGFGFIGIFCYRIHPSRDVKNVREFVEVSLHRTLVKDSLYSINISLLLDNESNIAIKNFGIYFSDKFLAGSKENKMFSLKPQIEFNSSFLDSTNQWITLQSFYKAGGFEKFIVIGNFRTDRRTSIKSIIPLTEKDRKKKWDIASRERATYYYVDDIIVEKAIIPKENQVTEKKVTENPDTFNIEEIEIDSAVVLKNIVFDFDKYDLRPESFKEINKLYNLMKNHPSVRIKLEGHTDNIGSFGFNTQLSLKRAESVATWLIQNGISPNRIEIAGYSYSNPVASNDTEEGREQNRRVVFKIIEK